MRSSFLFLIMVCISTVVESKDFGKQGNTFEVKEEGFITMIKRKLQGVDLQEHGAKMKDLARKRVEEPTSLDGITRTKKERSYSFDPSYTLDEDIYLPCGKLLYARGTSVNPLDQMDWGEMLVFIDGRDESQIKWLKRWLQGNTGDNAKVILTGGKPLELKLQLERQVYFDQFAELTKKFNITQVPAIVEQDGKYLRIREVYIGQVQNMEGR